SDLQRTRLPADRIVNYLALQQSQPLALQPLQELRERNLGIFQGRKYGEVDTGGKSLVDYVFEVEGIPGGESKSKVIERARRFAEGHLQKYTNGEGKVGLVGHGWWINYLINVLLGDHSRPYNRMQNLEMVHLSVGGLK
ncbi:MAG: histidine phosphatase family protein, partial [Nanoarchaeota archaeon]